jgi:hypothetical protein
MDPRIGMLMREGKTVHYAHVAGYASPPFEGSLEAVEVALGIRPAPPASRPATATVQPKAPARRSKSLLKTYIVTVTPKMVVYCGSYTEREHEVQIDAKTSAEAIKLVRQRRRAEDGSLTVPATFRARQARTSD